MPVSDIEICYRSTTTCLLGNIALRSGARLEFDSEKQTLTDPNLRKWLSNDYRNPWKLSV